MSMIDNYLHFNHGSLEIRISGLEGVVKALNRIADELKKSNNQTGKHFIKEN